jgi:plastocyanin
MRTIPAALLVIGAMGCSSSTPTSNNTVPPPQVNDITIGQGAQNLAAGAFTPNPKNVALSGGASVSIRFVNDDADPGNYGATGTAHHIVSDDGTSFDTGVLDVYHTSTKTLTTAGTYNFHCSIHPTMVGSIVVAP